MKKKYPTGFAQSLDKEMSKVDLAMGVNDKEMAKHDKEMKKMMSKEALERMKRMQSMAS